MGTPMYLTALFIIAISSLKCPSTDKWIFCHLQQCGWTWKVLLCLSKVRERHVLCDMTYFKKINLNTTKRNRFTDIEIKLVFTSGEREEEKGMIEVGLRGTKHYE